MIISGSNAEIQRNDLLKENAFKIKATGKAFQILSDGLYADKVKAVIRELSCNAFDAHIAAGKANERFTIHLPSVLEPYFMVRDYGIGLSMDAVMHIFTTYFESLKNDSNDFIGGLGLGSKSPFSYVDAFTVVSRFNGVRYSFTAFIGEDDMPKIALLDEQPTDEGNGLEVSMPVRSSDFGEFQNKARVVLSRFNPQPQITGVPNFQFEPRNVLLEGNGWRLMDKFSYYHDTQIAAAVQGNIGYPIATASLGELQREYHTVLSNPFEFDFNIGDLDIAASREALGYKKGTIANIKKAVDRMYAELPTKFEDRFSGLTTAWDGYMAWHDLFNQGTNLSYLLREMANTQKIAFTVAGKVIKGNLASFKYHDVPSIVVRRYSGTGSATIYTAATQDKNAHFTVQASKETEFFLNDLPKGSLARLKQYSKSKGHYHTVYLIEGSDADIQTALDELGNPPTRNTSELPAVVRAKSVRVPCRVLSPSSWGGLQWTEKTDLDLEEDTGFFVHYARGYPLNEHNRSIDRFEAIYNKALSLKLISKTDMIVGANANLRDKLAKIDDWTNLIDHLTTKLTEQMNASTSLAEQLGTMRSLESFQQNNYYGKRVIEAIAQHRNKLDPNSPLGVFSSKMNDAQQIKIGEQQELADLLNVKLPEATGGYDFANEYNAIVKRYPVFKMMQSYGYDKEQSKILLEYVQLVDK
jgi:hypothetical protein